MKSPVALIPRYSTTKHWIQEIYKADIQFWPVWDKQGCKEKKIYVSIFAFFQPIENGKIMNNESMKNSLFYSFWEMTFDFEVWNSKSRGICQSHISLYCKVLWSISGLIRKWRRNVKFSRRIALGSSFSLLNFGSCPI